MHRTLAVAFLLSCTHTRPTEMTAAEHRSEAKRHTEVARQEREQFKPELTVRYPGRSPYVQSPRDWTATYNPTERHLEAADREMEKAAEHLAAAKRLETFEDAACREIPREQRGACPLLASWVVEVRDTQRGIALKLKERVDAADTNRRLNCHLAYAEANGFTRPSCPLFVPGMSIWLAGENVIEMRGNTPDAVKALQEQARRIFLGAAAPAPAVSQLQP